ncbi:MAG: diguanylate cyclase [Actinomycetota bacterium]|nr:diguanylate cyclase [Actinomycetota bacterium]MDA8166671.1 diguanylate cyclase [Actinomycetota bacterium]
MKLGTKLYLFFAGVVILPLVAVTVLSSVALSRSGQDTYRARMQSSLAAASAIIFEQDRGLAGDLQAAMQRADTGALVSGNGAARQPVLDKIRSETGADAVVLAGAAGQTLAQSGSAGVQAPLLKSGVDLTSGAGAQGQVYALKQIDTSTLGQVFSPQDLDWMILSGNTRLAGSLPGGGLQPAAGTKPPPAVSTGRAPAQPSPEFQAVAGGHDLVVTELSLPAGLTSVPLTLAAAVPASTVRAASSQALEAGLGLTALLLVLAALLGFLLARTITGPLRKLNEAAAASSAGDLGRHVEIRSRDEIGGLAASFNLMQSNIRNYVNELEESRSQLMLALTYAGDILGATSDRSRLIKTVAEAARLATGAAGVWVQLFAEIGPPGHGSIFVGAPADFFSEGARNDVRRMADRIGSGIMQAGEIHRLDNEMLAIGYPLMHDRQSLGALVAVFSESAASEGESRRRILNSLATQAASAVENVNFSELQQMLAVTDPMTGLANFRSFQHSLSQEVSKSRRYGHVLSLAIIDLDDFKLVNDRYGHQCGDELLKAVGAALSKRVRGTDVVARYGGEEFAVIFPETSKKAAMRVSESLRRAIAGLRLAGAGELRVTASIGVATFPEDAADDNRLVGRADASLYRAKEEGKDRVMAWESTDEDSGR